MKTVSFKDLKKYYKDKGKYLMISTYLDMNMR